MAKEIKIQKLPPRPEAPHRASGHITVQPDSKEQEILTTFEVRLPKGSYDGFGLANPVGAICVHARQELDQTLIGIKNFRSPITSLKSPEWSQAQTDAVTNRDLEPIFESIGTTVSGLPRQSGADLNEVIIGVSDANSAFLCQPIVTIHCATTDETLTYLTTSRINEMIQFGDFECALSIAALLDFYIHQVIKLTPSSAALENPEKSETISIAPLNQSSQENWQDLPNDQHGMYNEFINMIVGITPESHTEFPASILIAEQEGAVTIPFINTTDGKYRIGVIEQNRPTPHCSLKEWNQALNRACTTKDITHITSVLGAKRIETTRGMGDKVKQVKETQRELQEKLAKDELREEMSITPAIITTTQSLGQVISDPLHTCNKTSLFAVELNNTSGLQPAVTEGITNISFITIDEILQMISDRQLTCAYTKAIIYKFMLEKNLLTW